VDQQPDSRVYHKKKKPLKRADKQHPCPIHAWTWLKPSKHDSVPQIIDPLQTIIINGAMRIDSLISKDFVPVSHSSLSLPPFVPAGKFLPRNMKRKIVRYCLKYVLNSYSTLIHDPHRPRELRGGVVCNIPYFHYREQGVCSRLSAVCFRKRDRNVRTRLGVDDAGWIEADIISDRRSSYR